MRCSQVTVVIPTTGRASLEHAVSSATAQNPARVLVAVSPADDVEAVARLERHDARIKTVVAESPVPGGALRQLATEHVDSEYVAYLDDDDRLHEDSLGVRRNAFDEATWLVSGQVAFFDGNKPDIVTQPAPETVFAGDAPLTSWLFSERRIWRARPLLHTSTLMLRTEDALSIGWDTALRRHQDWDFLLRGQSRFHDRRIRQLDEVVAHVETGTGVSISASGNARASLEWFDDRKHFFDDAAASAFLTGHVGRYALMSRDWPLMREVLHLVRERRSVPHASSMLEMASGAVPRRELERLFLLASKSRR